MKSFVESWRIHLGSRAFRNELALTLIVFFAAGAHNIQSLIRYELRQGIQLNDPLLSLLTPIDFSNFIFIGTYGIVLTTLIVLLTTPQQLARGLQMFALLTMMRTLSVYLMPLEAPQDMIFLVDPFANVLMHTPSIVVTKDLFFSGHTATIALMFFLAEQRWHKYMATAVLAVVPSMILWQHVHYTIDVIAAIPAAYLSFRIVNHLHKQRETGRQLLPDFLR